MQPEKELIRNFCPYDIKIVEPTILLSCPICGTYDLIPTPYSFKEKEKVTITPTEWKDEPTFIVEQKSETKIGIDPIVKEGLKSQFCFLTGKAGSGKSTALRLMSENGPNYIELTSTTGIAAVNLGGRTIHSTLKFFNLKSLENNYNSGKLQWELRKVRNRKRVLGIEEVSMLGAQQLDFIAAAVDEINNDRSGKELGIHLCGDLAQLPVISRPPENMKMVFKSEYWDRFQNNTVKLEKIWRQTNPDFIEAMNLVRVGKGKEAVLQLQKCGVVFKDEVDWNFDGTTLIPLNDKVDYYNTKRLGELKTPMIRTVSKKFGVNLNEWDKLIPAELRLKIGAYVMILSNDIPNFNYVNGDTGLIKDYDMQKDKFSIELTRTKQIVKIGRIVRENISDQSPGQSNFTGNFHPYICPKTSDWVIGLISFHPLRLAYASTIHKSQGLSLDRVQIDTKHSFFSAPAMSYVAMSRARTSDGLILVGRPEEIANKIRINPEVIPYL